MPSTQSMHLAPIEQFDLPALFDVEHPVPTGTEAVHARHFRVAVPILKLSA